MARPETEPKTALGRRLRAIRSHFGDPERDEWASKLGVSKNTLASYERGETEPTASVLSAYRVQFGISVQWLLSEEGGMFDDPSMAPAPALQVDPALMEKLYKAVERVYKDAGQRPSGHRLANEATTLFNVLLDRIKDVRDSTIVDAVIPSLATELVDRLSKAAKEPGTGKRSA